MPLGNAPAQPPYIPRGNPQQPPPNRGRSFFKAAKQIDQSGHIFEKYVSIFYTQFWQLIHFHDFACGQRHVHTVKTTVGVSETHSEKVGSELDVEQDGIASKLSTELGHSITFSEQREDSHQIDTTAAACKGISLSSWQLVDSYEFTVVEEHAFGIVTTDSYTIEHPLHIYRDDPVIYDRPDCCPETRTSYLHRGDADVFAVDYPGARLVSVGAVDDKGCIRLHGIEGHYGIGSLLPAAQLPDSIAGMVLAGGGSMGVVDRYQGDKSVILGNGQQLATIAVKEIGQSMLKNPEALQALREQPALLDDAIATIDKAHKKLPEDSKPEALIKALGGPDKAKALMRTLAAGINKPC